MTRVQDVMTDEVQTVAPTLTAADAWETFWFRGIHHLVVTDGAEVVGVLSERDMGGRSGATLRKDRTVADLMTTPVVVVAPDTPIRKAANLMRGRSIGCLVVTRRNRVAGIITVSDLLALLGRGEGRPASSGSRTPLRHRAPHRKRHTSTGAW